MRPAGPLRFIHVSDLHILADEGRRQYGADTGAILRQAVPMLNALEPDLVIAGGDLVSDESEASYRRLRALLEPLRPPIHFVMGNHDDRAAFRRVFRPAEPASAEPVCEAFERGGVRFLLLDSLLPGKVEGRLAEAQLRWLERELSAHPDRPAWVVLHHHPLPIYLRWLDALRLTNGEALLDVLGRHPQVEAVAYGHIHQARRWRHQGTLFLGVPALAFQLSPVSQEMAVTPEPPGFRLVEIEEDRRRCSLYFLDGRIEEEPSHLAIPIYVREPGSFTKGM
jgi:Icc protein